MSTLFELRSKQLISVLVYPSPDPVNILLSLGYTLLYKYLYAAINVVDLDPYQGFFHQLKRGHAALASDLVEDWRAIIADFRGLKFTHNSVQVLDGVPGT